MRSRIVHATLRLLRPADAIEEALASPLALAFSSEAMLLVVTLARLFRKWGMTRLG